MIAREIDVCTVTTLSLNKVACRYVERMEGGREERGREEGGKRRGKRGREKEEGKKRGGVGDILLALRVCANLFPDIQWLGQRYCRTC